MIFLDKIYWWIRYRTINRWHVVPTTLTPGWHDADVRILYAAFGLFKDFIEIEWLHLMMLNYKHRHIKLTNKNRSMWARYYLCEMAEGAWKDSRVEEDYPGQAEEEKKYYADVLELYDWWVKRETKKSLDFSDNQYDEDDEMLHKLIKVRRGLWT